MNGKIILGLSQLKEIYTRDNECIKQDFTNETQIAEFPQKIDESCGFSDNTAEEQICEGTKKIEESSD